MNPTRVVAGCAAAVALGAVALFTTRLSRLPHTRLADGGEFRVVHISYGTDHHLDGAPRPVRWLWQHLPLFLQGRISEPQKKAYGRATDTPSLSVWWAWIDPATNRPEFGPSDNAIMTLDSGERVNLRWPDPCEGGYREILVFPPPLHSRFLKFHVVVNEERVDFTVRNPAFRESLPSTEFSVFPMPVVQKTSGVEPRDECVVVDFPDPIRAPKSGGEFEIEYRLSNQLGTELCVAVDPTDHVTSSFRDRNWFTHKHEVTPANSPASRFATVGRRELRGGVDQFQSCTRRALISLPSAESPKGTLYVTIPVDGYFRDSGQRFHGSIDTNVAVITSDE